METAAFTFKGRVRPAGEGLVGPLKNPLKGILTVGGAVRAAGAGTDG